MCTGADTGVEQHLCDWGMMQCAIHTNAGACDSQSYSFCLRRLISLPLNLHTADNMV